MDADTGPLAVDSILASLSRQILGPLDQLQTEIDLFLDNPVRPISEAERTQAETMLKLCDDLGQLTQDRLGGRISESGR